MNEYELSEGDVVVPENVTLGHTDHEPTDDGHTPIFGGPTSILLTIVFTIS